MNMFERASRAKLRVHSSIGVLAIEQLWDLPLITQRSNSVDLNTIAKGLNKKLKDLGEEEFVEAKPNDERTHLELAFEIVKYIIESKQKAKATAEKAAATAATKSKLLEMLEKKEDEKFEKMSADEIKAALNAMEIAN